MQMITITSVEFQRNFGLYQDTAFKEPIAITRNGRERIVVLSAEEYHRLKRRDRQVMRLEDLTEADLQAILQAEPPPEAAAFNQPRADLCSLSRQNRYRLLQSCRRPCRPQGRAAPHCGRCGALSRAADDSGAAGRDPRRARPRFRRGLAERRFAAHRTSRRHCGHPCAFRPCQRRRCAYLLRAV